METNILVIGAGLAGLALARQLERAGIAYRIIEARDRIGGRILSVPTTADSSGTARYDMGPAWFWPGQPLIAQLAGDLGLTVFEQYASGNLVFEGPDGSIRRDITMAPMAGSLRLDGGMAGLVDGLAREIPPERMVLNHRCDSIRQDGEALVAAGQHGNTAFEIQARQIVLAMPPRLAADSIEFQPALPGQAIEIMRAIPTWMAGHAKVIAVYDTPFWRQAGLSGDAMSHRGPLAEVHDASPWNGPEGALFGFVGVPSAHRRLSTFDLETSSIVQLSRLFGPAAGNPISVLTEDWANQPFTATRLDDDPPTRHPAYGTPNALNGLFNGQLVLGSTEMASDHGGFLEGALEAADMAFRLLK